jgi:hypothetical protein
LFTGAFRVYGLGLAIASTWIMTANNGLEMAWKNDVMAYPKVFNIFTFYAEACKVLVGYPMILKLSWVILRYSNFSQLILSV